MNGCVTESVWLKSGNFLRLVDVPNTLPGEILRLKKAMPPIEGNFEINGNEINTIKSIPPRPTYDDDTEDITEELALLPTVEVDEEKHHLKKGRYKSEIQTLLKCQGGSYPGRPLSPHVIPLLGKSKDGELVFEKLSDAFPILLCYHLQNDGYGNWLKVCELYIPSALSTATYTQRTCYSPRTDRS
jgi:hypothetical protein